MKKYLIIVPKDKEIETKLDYDNANDEELIIITLTQHQFIELKNLNIFNIINKFANCFIQEYEDDKIIDEDLILKCLNYLKTLNNNKVNDLIYIFNEANERKTGIYFYF
jgi:hypothetical protein